MECLNLISVPLETLTTTFVPTLLIIPPLGLVILCHVKQQCIQGAAHYIIIRIIILFS